MSGSYVDLSHARWRKSSYSASNGGECVEAASVWRKSSYSSSNGGDCVEVAPDPGRLVAVRDSKDPDGPKLLLTPMEWRTFTARIKEQTASRTGDCLFGLTVQVEFSGGRVAVLKQPKTVTVAVEVQVAVGVSNLSLAVLLVQLNVTTPFAAVLLIPSITALHAGITPCVVSLSCT